MLAGIQYGISGALEAPLYVYLIIISFFTLAFYNSLELQVIIWMRFKQYRSLYFVSLVTSSCGVSVISLLSILKIFGIWNDLIALQVFQATGWVAMVTGQSLVLYSRLHLVTLNRRVLRGVLFMIIIDAFLFHIPVIIIGIKVRVISLLLKALDRCPDS
jgi:hypothetical protein